MPCNVKPECGWLKVAFFGPRGSQCELRPSLERYVFVGDFRRVRSLVSVLRALIKACVGGSAARSLGFAAFAAAAQQHQIVGNDLCAVLLLAALFVFPA